MQIARCGYVKMAGILAMTTSGKPTNTGSSSHPSCYAAHSRRSQMSMPCVQRQLTREQLGIAGGKEGTWLVPGLIEVKVAAL